MTGGCNVIALVVDCIVLVRLCFAISLLYAVIGLLLFGGLRTGSC